MVDLGFICFVVNPELLLFLLYFSEIVFHNYLKMNCVI